MFGKDLFIAGLKQFDYVPENKEGNLIEFSYLIRGGRFKDTKVSVRIDVPTDFGVTCPSGLNISPQLIPLNPNGTGNDRAAESPFGSDWEYLSRPFIDQAEGWNRTTKDVKAYLRHIKRILETL